MIAGELTKIYFIANDLAYSRRIHCCCTDSCDAEHAHEGLMRLFEYFGGVAREVLVNNQRAVVLVHRPAGELYFNEGSLDLAGRYGNLPRASTAAIFGLSAATCAHRFCGS